MAGESTHLSIERTGGRIIKNEKVVLCLCNTDNGVTVVMLPKEHCFSLGHWSSRTDSGREYYNQDAHTLYHLLVLY